MRGPDLQDSSEPKEKQTCSIDLYQNHLVRQSEQTEMVIPKKAFYKAHFSFT